MASPKQLAMVQAIRIRKGLTEQQFLEWLEFDSGLNVGTSHMDGLASLNNQQFNHLLTQIEKLPDREDVVRGRRR